MEGKAPEHSRILPAKPFIVRMFQMRELQTEGAAVHSKWEPKRKSIGRRFDPLWVGWVLESPVSPTVDDTHSYREIFYIDTYVYILYIVVIVIKYNINNNGHHNNNNSFFVLLSFFLPWTPLVWTVIVWYSSRAARRQTVGWIDRRTDKRKDRGLYT